MLPVLMVGGCISEGYYKGTVHTPLGIVSYEHMANVSGPPKESTDKPFKWSFDPDGFDMVTSWLDSDEPVDATLGGKKPSEKADN